MGSESAHSKKARLARTLETAFIALACLYLAISYAAITTLFLPLPQVFGTCLFSAMCAVALARLLIDWRNRIRRVDTWLMLALAALYGLVFLKDRYTFLLYTAVLIVGFSGIDYRRILRAYLLTVGVLLAVTVIAALSGAIINIINYRDGVRSSWGICYPTDLASTLLFTLLVLWVVADRWPEWAMLLPCAACMAVVMCVAESRNVQICASLFFVMILYAILEKRLRMRNKLGWLRGGLDALATFAFPLCAAAMFAMVFLYARGTGLGDRLNLLMSDRLSLSLKALRTYPLKPFGTPFEQLGRGFSSMPLLDEHYTFVDSSYVLIPLRYGYALFAANCACWCWMTRRAIRCGNRRMALAMAIIAVHSIMEHHFPEPWFNVMLLLPFVGFPQEAEMANDGRSRLARNLAAGVAVAAFAAIALLAPRLISWLNTLFSLLDLTGGGAGAYFVILIIAGGLAALFGVGWALWRIVLALASRERVPRRAWIALGLCACLLVGGALAGNGAISSGCGRYEARLEADSGAIEAALAANGRVYARSVPEVYARRFPGLRRSWLPVEDLSRSDDATVLTDARAEITTFFQRGYQYAQISDDSALYTRDPAVADALVAAGYTVAGFCYTPREVDLGALAEANGLEYSPESGILIDGPLASLSAGPEADLSAGSYIVTYELSMPTPPEAGENACTLDITAFWGEVSLGERSVSASEFDGDGALTVAVPLEIAPQRAVEFKLLGEDGCRIYVRRLSYVKVA